MKAGFRISDSRGQYGKKVYATEAEAVKAAKKLSSFSVGYFNKSGEILKVSENRNSFNFRFTEDREAFYVQLKKDWATYTNNDAEIGSELRVVFPIGEFTKAERLQQEKAVRTKDENAFQGLRTFRSFQRLKKFLNDTKQGGSGISWGTRILPTKESIVRLCIYKLRNNRIVGETILKKYRVTYDR